MINSIGRDANDKQLIYIILKSEYLSWGKEIVVLSIGFKSPKIVKFHSDFLKEIHKYLQSDLEYQKELSQIKKEKPSKYINENNSFLYFKNHV
jgi:hypothetical protein